MPSQTTRPSTLYGTQPWSYLTSGCTTGERELSSSDFFSRGGISSPVGGILFPAGKKKLKIFYYLNYTSIF